MKTGDIPIRDPYILVYQGKYYMYGTRNKSVWGKADGFDAYVSADLNLWEGPCEIFHRPDGFWADECYWAPECICKDGMFYLTATFAAADRKKGILFLKSDNPLGPFTPTSMDRVTPADWTCIDGTVYREDDTYWLIFSHGFPEDLSGSMMAMKIRNDFTGLTGEPVRLFRASEASWARPVPFAKTEFGIDEPLFFVDGPSVIGKENGKLQMIFSSWGTGGYTVGIAESDSGKLLGKWHHINRIICRDSGHGMVFTEMNGKRMLAVHAPNDTPNERPVFLNLDELQKRDDYDKEEAGL